MPDRAVPTMVVLLLALVLVSCGGGGSVPVATAPPHPRPPTADLSGDVTPSGATTAELQASRPRPLASSEPSTVAALTGLASDAVLGTLVERSSRDLVDASGVPATLDVVRIEVAQTLVGEMVPGETASVLVRPVGGLPDLAPNETLVLFAYRSENFADEVDLTLAADAGLMRFAGDEPIPAERIAAATVVSAGPLPALAYGELVDRVTS